MQSRSYYKSGWLRAAMAVMVVAAMCAMLGLTACGNKAEQSTASDEASTEATSTEATSTEASSTESADAQDAVAGAPAEAYMLAKTVLNTNDGGTYTDALDIDDQGRQLGNHYEEVSPDSSLKVEYVVSDWDEYGHILKSETTYDDGSGKPYTETEEVTNDVNEDGTLAKQTDSVTVHKDSFEEGEIASKTTAWTYEYGDDAQVLRRCEYKSDFFDQSGTLVTSGSAIYEFDEDGLQTSFTTSFVDSEGNKGGLSATITWTKDADGKPTSVEMALNIEGEDTQTLTADVVVDESGLVSQIKNVVVDGEARSTNLSVERKRIENPLPNAYEGWKSFTLTDYLISSQ